METIVTRLNDLWATVSAWIDSLGVDTERLAQTLLYDSHQPLLFNTGLFIILFALFLVFYRVLRPWKTGRMLFVIAFSLYFYYKSSGAYCLILIGVAVSDYILGLAMQRARDFKRGRVAVMKLIVALNVLCNVFLLAYFKYFGLLINTINEFFSQHIDPLNVLLPAGISFFTFRSISYIVDIYRGHIDACRNFLDYFFFLTFFPPLLAGPVVRAKEMLPQIKENPQPTRDMTSEGIYLIILGIFKKMVIADFISGNFVDRVFDNPALYSGFENFMATVGFTVQLYCDFSGYSDMAIGIALLLGYRFKENFNSPFKAQSPTEFWHRWHISLSTWLRDYIYIPLGGNRCSRPRAYFNQFATMVIGGLWHGASWMYVIWGAVHGALLVVHKMLRGLLPELSTVTQTVVTENGEIEAVTTPSRFAPLVKLANMIFTFMLIAAAFMLFRARSMEDVGMMWHQIINDFHLSVAPQFIESYLTIVLAMGIGYFIHMLPDSMKAPVKRGFMASPAILQGLLLGLVLLLAIQVRSSDIVPFIYLQY